MEKTRRCFGGTDYRYGQLGVAFNALLLLVTLALAAPDANARDARIVMLGDSITAAYGLPPGDALPVRLAEELQNYGITATVENAGVSGDTSAGGLARFDWAIQGTPDMVVVALGANDGLRGIDPDDTRRNLGNILTRLRERQVTSVLVGMLAPPNMGAEYGAQFNAIYPDLAEAHDVALYPFLLEGVAAQPALNQDDGIHPNARGAKIIANKLAEKIAPMIR